MTNALPKRSIRTFVMRQGRMTQGQQQSLDKHWPSYGLEVSNGEFNYTQIFNSDAPVIIEIGFGMGDSLIEMAKNNPQYNYIGIEVHPPGVGRCLHLLVEHELSNLRICKDDALCVFEQCVSEASLAGIQIFFPDPWQKKKHHKRRIINPQNVMLFSQKLQQDGFLHIATDWQDYALHIQEVLESALLLEKMPAHAEVARPTTKFEQRGMRLGHKVFDFHYQRIKE